MDELRNRRDKLFALMKDNSVAIFFSGVGKIMSEDENYPFLSNRNFFYLTNIEQENSALILIKGLGEKKTYLFIEEYDEVKEKWTGKRLTSDEATYISDIDNVRSMNSFESMLKLALTNNDNQYGQISTLYLDLSPELKIKDSYSTVQLADFINNEYPHITIENSHPYLSNLRMKKSSEEIAELINAINYTNSGLLEIITSLKEDMHEYELADIFEMHGRKLNRLSLSFPTIVARDKNATVLHYPSQNDIIKNNSLVLFDLGYKSNGYCADISRTYPVNGVFEGNQRKIYQAVLNCNKAVINYIKPGLTIKELQEFAKDYLKKECVRLKLLNERDDISRYYYHNVSHHLGLDTHDTADSNKPLENGNVITVEPGLYFAELGIGVRVEDDVLIQNDKGECLSKGIAKEIEDIEALFKGKK